jgi:N-formylglutamate amidohydrolase
MEWVETLSRILAERIGRPVTLNDPFKGGFITRSHANEMPWIQIELSRGGFATAQEKSRAVRSALKEWLGRL